MATPQECTNCTQIPRCLHLSQGGRCHEATQIYIAKLEAGIETSVVTLKYIRTAGRNPAHNKANLAGMERRLVGLVDKCSAGHIPEGTE